MAIDKSATHQRVIKNGIEGWIPKEAWDKMVEDKKTEGFQPVASTPPEAEIIKRKAKKEKVEEPGNNAEPVAEIEPSLLGADASKK